MFGGLVFSAKAVKTGFANSECDAKRRN